jgi:uncharacterized protein YkwD
MPARSRKLLVLTAFIGVLCLGTPGIASASCAGADLRPNAGNVGDVEAATLCLLNEQRQANGLRPLVRNGLLDTASEAHSRDMVVRHYFEHVSLNGTTPRQRMEAAGYTVRNLTAWAVGENIAWGTNILGTPARIVNAWMNSPGHRENILKATYREIGVGVSLGVPSLSFADFLGATYTTDFGYRALPASRPASSKRKAAARRSCTRRTRSARRRCRR